MNELIGKTIKSICMDKENSVLVFMDHNNTPHVYITEGDCCAHCWFESINNVENMIDSVVLSVRENPSTTIEQDSSDCTDINGYTISTLKGYTDIEYRAEHNGYYAGWCKYRKDYELLPSAHDGSGPDYTIKFKRETYSPEETIELFKFKEGK